MIYKELKVLLYIHVYEILAVLHAYKNVIIL